MTRRERDLVRRAELAAMGPEDAPQLLAQVTGAMRGMVKHGRVREADHVMAAMLPSTSRLVALAALGDLDRQSEHSSNIVDLFARHERSYVEALERELEGEAEARQRADEIAAEAEQKLQDRQRDRDFLARLSARRNRGHQ